MLAISEQVQCSANWADATREYQYSKNWPHVDATCLIIAPDPMSPSCRTVLQHYVGSKIKLRCRHNRISTILYFTATWRLSQLPWPEEDFVPVLLAGGLRGGVFLPDERSGKVKTRISSQHGDKVGSYETLPARKCMDLTIGFDPTFSTGN